MSAKWQIIILISAGLLIHFMFFGHPNQTVFDEVHFGKFISGYYTREYFFDIHPPLGKLLIAGFAKLFNFQPGFAFSEIGNKFPDNQYLILRFLPNLAGSLLPLVIFLLLIEMGVKRTASFFGGLFVALDNALLTQSHYILLDSFLLLFGFLALLFYFKFKKSLLHQRTGWTGNISNLMFFGAFSGLAISVKWTGLSFLALPLFLELIKVVQTKNLRSSLKTILIPMTIALSLYFVIFSAHLIILNKSGPGDAFMSIGFQKTLAGNIYTKNGTQPSNFFQRFIELNTEMYKANQRLNATHPYSSQWYSWPFMTRPIYYWVSQDERIYLLGNPVIWWLSTVAIILFILQSIKTKLDEGKLNAVGLFLFGGYVVNMLPFIGVKRVMFLYHYFTAYIFAIMLLAWLISRNGNSKNIFRAISIAGVIAFLFFAPLSYGLSLSSGAYESRVWFESWR